MEWMNMSATTGYTKVIELGSKNEWKTEMMKLVQSELLKEDNRKRMGVVNAKLRDLKRSGRFKAGSDLGGTVVMHKNRKYYFYPNMLVEERKNDNTLRIVYLVGQNRDTIKLAREKCRALGLLESNAVTSIFIESMNLQGKG